MNLNAVLEWNVDLSLVSIDRAMDEHFVLRGSPLEHI